MPARPLRAAVVLTAGALVLASSAAVANAAGNAQRATVRVQVSAKHRVIAPASLRPGLVHVINTASRELMLVRKKHKGRSGYIKDYNRATNTAGSIRFYKDFDVVDVITSHTDEYLRLAKGTYYLSDDTTATVTSAQVRTVSVSGHRQSATAPRSSLVPVAANGHVPASVTVGRRYAHVVNHSATPHIVSIVSIRSSATAQQVRDAIADPARHDPFKLTGTYFAPLGLIAAHTDLYKRLRVRHGRYFLFAASLTHPGLAKGKVGLLTVK